MKHLSLLSAMFLMLVTQIIWGQIPETISYQGILTDGSGNPVPDGNYNLAFKLYDVATGGSALWTETQPVNISNGLLNVILGSGGNPLILDFDKPYWLGITVEAGPELSPRIELTSSAYSLNARSVADSAITDNKIANGTVVRSINSLTDSVTLAAGPNVTITPSGDSLTISAAGGGTDGDWIISGNNMYSGVSGNIGIGTTNPQRQLHIARSDYVTFVLEDTGEGTDQKKKFINVDNGSLRLGKFSDSWNYQPQLEITNSDFTKIIKNDRGLFIKPGNDNASLGYFQNNTYYFLMYLYYDTMHIQTKVYMASYCGIQALNPTHVLEIGQFSSTDPIADAWTVYSSRRWKNNIATIKNPIEKVQQLRGVSFDWNTDGKHDIGLISEEVGEVIPEVVVYEENGIDAKSVDYARLVAVLVEAVKEQQKQIEELKEIVNALQ